MLQPCPIINPLGVRTLMEANIATSFSILAPLLRNIALRKWREGVCFNKTINNHSREFIQERTNFFTRAPSLFF